MLKELLAALFIFCSPPAFPHHLSPTYHWSHALAETSAPCSCSSSGFFLGPCSTKTSGTGLPSPTPLSHLRTSSSLKHPSPPFTSNWNLPLLLLQFFKILLFFRSSSHIHQLQTHTLWTPGPLSSSPKFQHFQHFLPTKLLRNIPQGSDILPAADTSCTSASDTSSFPSSFFSQNPPLQLLKHFAHPPLESFLILEYKF